MDTKNKSPQTIVSPRQQTILESAIVAAITSATLAPLLHSPELGPCCGDIGFVYLAPPRGYRLLGILLERVATDDLRNLPFGASTFKILDGAGIVTDVSNAGWRSLSGPNKYSTALLDELGLNGEHVHENGYCYTCKGDLFEITCPGEPE